MTIKDIARESGYAISTVSRVMNGNPNVSPEARERILQVVTRTGFEPNANARKLKQQQTRSILFLMHTTSNPFLTSVLEQMQQIIAKAGYEVVVQYLQENQNPVRSANQLMREMKPKGMVFLGGNAEQFERDFGTIHLPSVLVAAVSRELQFENLAMVGVDDRKEAGRAVEYLLQNGHRQIAIIGGDPVYHRMSRLRKQGCELAMEAAGCSLEPGLYEQGGYTYAGGYAAAQRLLQKGKPFTALFAMSDVMAVGAMRALAEAGKRVPEEISVVGFDGTEMAAYCNPPLATLAQPAGEIAVQSAAQLFAQLEEKQKAQTVILNATLTQGKSVQRL